MSIQAWCHAAADDRSLSISRCTDTSAWKNHQVSAKWYPTVWLWQSLVLLHWTCSQSEAIGHTWVEIPLGRRPLGTLWSRSAASRSWEGSRICRHWLRTLRSSLWESNRYSGIWAAKVHSWWKPKGRSRGFDAMLQDHHLPGGEQWGAQRFEMSARSSRIPCLQNQRKLLRTLSQNGFHLLREPTLRLYRRGSDNLSHRKHIACWNMSIHLQMHPLLYCSDLKHFHPQWSFLAVHLF